MPLKLGEDFYAIQFQPTVERRTFDPTNPVKDRLTLSVEIENKVVFGLESAKKGPKGDSIQSN